MPAARRRKLPLDVGGMLARIERAIASFPKAALFELAELGHRSVFEQLLACIVSIRTRDETTLPASLRLFELGATPAGLARRRATEIDGAIRPATFHGPKARQILAIARAAVRDHGGRLPCDEQVLLSFAGVGPKCTNLVLGIACGEPRISVDVHVERVTSRWGLVSERTPAGTQAALERTVARRLWIDLNRLLVPFGKHVCTGLRPRCSTCPVLDRCRQVGVVDPR